MNPHPRGADSGQASEPRRAEADDAYAPRPLLGLAERWVLTSAAIVLLHAVLGALATVAESLARRPDLELRRIPWLYIVASLLPDEPLRLAGIALLLAQGSLIAVAAAQAPWPSYAKTLATVLAFLGLWSLILLLLPLSARDAARAAGWGAGLGTQMLAAGLFITLFDAATRRQRSAAQRRFSLLTLMLWVTLAAALLGGARAIAARLHLSVPVIVGWEYFLHLQWLGLSGAALAVALALTLHAPLTLLTRLWASVAVLVALAAGTLWVMHVLFPGNVGAKNVDICWLIAGQGLFLLAAWFPLLASRHIAESVRADEPVRTR